MPKYSYRRDPLTPQEVGHIIEEMDTPGMKALVAFLYLYGTRISEALKLERKDFVILKKGLKVNIHQEKKRTGSPLLYSHQLTVRGPSPYVHYIVDHLGMVSEGKIWPISRTTAWRKIHRVIPISPHFFRHTRASRLAEQTDNPFVLVDWFGWANANPAARYIQMSGRLASRLSDKVD